MKTILSIVFFLIVSGCALKKDNKVLRESTQQISITQLINNPEKYDGKRVEFQGYFIIAFENNAIYMHKDDYLFSIYKNAIWLGFNEYFFNQFGIQAPYEGYITIQGVYKKISQNHTSLFSGRLEDITYIERRWNIEEKK